MTKDVSALAPVHVEGAATAEDEKKSSWIARQAAASLTGRVVMSTYESLKTAGTVVCLSPWGDANPLSMPSVRFRDLLIQSVMAATGGTASIAAPALDPVSGALSASLGDTVVAQLVSGAAVDAVTGVADDKFIEGPIEDAIPNYDAARVIEATGVKTVLVSLTYQHTMSDAALGFYRSSCHRDDSPNSLFSNVKDYLAVEKGWFSPYLFASARRPVIPRTMTPDVVFCHGPFLSGDYKIGQVLLSESSRVASFSLDWSGLPPATASCEGDEKAAGGKLVGGLRKKFGKNAEGQDGEGSDGAATEGTNEDVPPTDDEGKTTMSKEETKAAKAAAKEEKATRKAAEKEAKAEAKAEEKAKKAEEKAKKTEQKTDEVAAEDAQGTVTLQPRHLALLLVGLKPHRGKVWASSQRPGESVIRYQLLGGVPALVLPAKIGAPLVSWDALTLGELQKLGADNIQSHVDSLFEFLDLCVDWARVGAGSLQGKQEKEKKDAVRNEVRIIVATAANSGQNGGVKNGVDTERAGIVFWRVP